jgi:hypothetical protein
MRKRSVPRLAMEADLVLGDATDGGGPAHPDWVEGYRIKINSESYTRSDGKKEGI